MQKIMLLACLLVGSSAEIGDYAKNQTITFTKVGNFQLITETITIKFVINFPKISLSIMNLTKEFDT
jgi:hypothetical protein